VSADPTYLLLEAGRGNSEAFDELVRQTQHDMQRFCQTLVGSNDANDVAQETFLRAWRSAASFAGSSNGRTWLFGVARNVAADHRRRFARRNRMRNFLSFTAVAANKIVSNTSRSETIAFDPADRHRFEEYAALNELVENLEPDRKEAFVLTQILGMSYAEVAEICAVPVGTIRSRVARARASLAVAYLAAQDPDVPPAGTVQGPQQSRWRSM
jgi:RNA polymerase sigma-70 factor, ECF subfamily